MQKTLTSLPHRGFNGIDHVDDLSDLSDETTTRARIHFTNGYQLSIIKGTYSYGGPEGFYEIAPFNKDGDMDGNLFDEQDQGDDVRGWCDESKVVYYIRKIGAL